MGADQLGFMGGPLNLVPGNKKLNNSEYISFENELRESHKDGHVVEAEFEAVYSIGNTNSRPDGFKVKYSLGGGEALTRKFTNTSEKRD